MNKKYIQFLQSFVAIPMFATMASLSGGVITNQVTTVALSENNSVIEASLITTDEADMRKQHAEEIDAFFEKRGSDLAGYGMKFVTEAEANGLDYRLLPAIATRESGGVNPCKNPKAPNNYFGWFSCTKGFSSVDQSIAYISKTLSGNNKNAPHYKPDMTVDQILKTYNPPSIVKNYSLQVRKIMKMINADEEIA